MTIQKSRSQKRIKVTTPAGRAVIRNEPRRKAKTLCTGCGGVLHGVSQTRGMAASKRNPSRPYAGVLCSKCSRSAIKSLVR